MFDDVVATVQGAETIKALVSFPFENQLSILGEIEKIHAFDVMSCWYYLLRNHTLNFGRQVWANSSAGVFASDNLQKILRFKTP